eukprot:gene495-623_t
MNRKERRTMVFKNNRNPDNLIVAGSVSPRLNVPDTIDTPPYIKGEPLPDMELDEPIDIPTQQDINGVREACKVARDILKYAGSLVKVGITTDEIDRLVHEEIIKRGAYPSTLGYKDFPKSLCTSINEVICHGIPDSRPLNDGDIVNLDITVYYKGYHGDTSATFPVGENVDKAALKLIKVTKEAMEAGIKAVKPGRPFNEIGKAIQTVAHKYSFGMPPEFTGHGIGKHFHTTPFVFHCANEFDHIMEPGMIFTVEPILVESPEPYVEWKLWNDDWTISSSNGGWSAQFEHTVLVTKDGYEILT